jgi:Arc/MetJ-type ribon-helix-helix transcriptional regulator
MSIKERLSASVDSELVRAAERAVKRGQATSVSAWVNEALQLKLTQEQRLESLASFVSAYEEEHGEISSEEIRLATRRARANDIVALIKQELLSRRPPITHGGIIGQVWRGGSGRQAGLARLLPGLDIKPLDAELGRRAGILLAQTRTEDVMHAALVLLAADGDFILTSDPSDIEPLAHTAAVHIDIVPV